MADEKKPRWKRTTAERYVKAWCELVDRTYRWATERGLSHEWIMEQTNDDYYIGRNGENYQRLPNWAKDACYIYNDAHWKTWCQSWIWTHVIDNIRSDSHDARFDGRLSEISDANPTASEQERKDHPDRSMHCYAYLLGYDVDDPRIVYVPVNDADVKSEMDSGRLTQADLNEVCKIRGIPLPRVVSRNKRLFVEVEVAVSDKDTGKVRFPHSPNAKCPKCGLRSRNTTCPKCVVPMESLTG